MSEEAKRDWKAQRIDEYIKLENIVTTETRKMDTDPDLDMLRRERAKLNEMIELGQGLYIKTIEAAQQQQIGIKSELVEKWDIEEKTFECAAGTATLRTTRSLHIKSKEKLVEFLATIHRLPDFIKSFETVKLRKTKDAGLLGDEIATWDEKKSVAIKIAEAEQ